MSETMERRAVRIAQFMDDNGHTSLGWDEADDAWVLPMIRAKMEAGFVFWIVKRNPLREVRLERVEDIGRGGDRHVIIRDDASRQLFEQGRIGLVRDDLDDREVVGRARTAEEVVANDTVAHRALQGG